MNTPISLNYITHFNLTNRYIPYRICNRTNDLTIKCPQYSHFLIVKYLQQIYPLYIRNTFIIRNSKIGCEWNDKLQFGLNLIPILNESWTPEDVLLQVTHVCLLVINKNYLTTDVYLINEHKTQTEYIKKCIYTYITNTHFNFELLYDNIQLKNDDYCVAYMALFIEYIMTYYNEFEGNTINGTICDIGEAILYLKPLERIDMIVTYWNNLYKRIVEHKQLYNLNNVLDDEDML